MNETFAQCENQLRAEQVAVTTFIQNPDRAACYDPISPLLIRQAFAKLQSIQLALARLRDGYFGECAVCHRPIDVERLIAIPYTELCIDCQRRAEHSNTRNPNGSASAA